MAPEDHPSVSTGLIGEAGEALTKSPRQLSQAIFEFKTEGAKVDGEVAKRFLTLRVGNFIFIDIGEEKNIL